MLPRVLTTIPLALAALALPAVAPGPADAAVVVDSDASASNTDGIAAASDGTYWVARASAGSVVQVSATGRQLGPPVPLGGEPSDVAVADDGSVWVSVPTAQKLVRISGGSVGDVLTAGCQPVALAAGAGRVFFSVPGASPGCSAGQLGSVAMDGSGLASLHSGFGSAYDLAVGSGKLFVPDFDGDVVRRTSLTSSLTVEATVGVAAGSSPNGITVVGGTVWTTLFSTGRLASFPVTQATGSAAEVTPSVTLGSPFGIAASSHGTLYVASRATSAVVDVAPAGAATALPLPTGAEPQQLAPTPDGALVTDLNRTSLSRIADAAPTLGSPRATARSSVSAAVTVPVDTHGDQTTVTVDYGKSAAYGRTATAAPQAASASGPATVTVVVPGLRPGQKVHLRVRATNVRGQAVSPDLTLKAPKAPRTTYAAQVTGRRTTLSALTVKGLTGAETVTVACRSKAQGCPFTKKTGKVKKGEAVLGKLFRGHPLAPGAEVTVRVVADGAKVSRLTLVVRAGQPPKVTRR